MCVFYHPNVAGRCTEEGAEEVREKERANFCDYYKPQPGAYQAPDNSKSSNARGALDALFGGSPEEDAQTGKNPDAARKNLEDLFKPPD